MAEPIVIVFTKAPEPGRVKTRLAKELGDDAAAALYRKVGGEVFARLKSLSGVRLVVAAAPEGDLTLLTSWLGPDIELWIQSGRGLGERMAHAARDAFEEGASKVIIVGCDGPELSAETVTDALAALEAADAVFVPTRDGGYILVGLARYVPNLFTGMAYGHDAVLRDTTARAEQLGLRVAKLPEQKDLDEPEDLRLFPELAHWVEQGAFGHGKERSES
ncbi:MAG: TIGR04282 family arsenosugar biosynthesis glycosyltransferase [Deltaproteobacteria bacterium]|nr:TIGR04282 family arsenosugar biosynthesis glycosyltransferase [Deltaproteobacteria bacterium]